MNCERAGKRTLLQVSCTALSLLSIFFSKLVRRVAVLQGTAQQETELHIQGSKMGELTLKDMWKTTK